LLLQAISKCDRRAGALKVLIKETEKRVAEQDECSARLEAEIAAVHRDVGHLSIESEHMRITLQRQEDMHWKLQDNRRRLLEDYDDEALKQRHRMLDMDQNMLSARSELSTVCTVRDLASSPCSILAFPPKSGEKGSYSLREEVHQVRPGARTAPPVI